MADELSRETMRDWYVEAGDHTGARRVLDRMSYVELRTLLDMASRAVSVATLGRLTTVLLAEEGDEDTDVSEELALERFAESALRDLRPAAAALIEREGKDGLEKLKEGG